MSDCSFELQTEEARLLLQTALVATGKNLFKSAAGILAALEAFRPDEVSVAVAKAILMISVQDFELALSFLDGEALVKWPDSAMLKAFRGMALIRAGRKDDAVGCLTEAAQSDDKAAANLAVGLLTDMGGNVT